MNPVQLWDAAKAAHPDHAGSIDARRASAGVDAAWARWQAPGNVWTATRYSSTWLLALVRDTPKQRHVTVWQRRRLTEWHLLVPVELRFARQSSGDYTGIGDARGWELSMWTAGGGFAAAADNLRAHHRVVLEWPQPYDFRAAEIDFARRAVAAAEGHEARMLKAYEATVALALEAYENAQTRTAEAQERLRALESEGGAA